MTETVTEIEIAEYDAVSAPEIEATEIVLDVNAEAGCVTDVARAYRMAVKEDAKRTKDVRVYEVDETPEREVSLHARDFYRRIERIMENTVESVKDPSELVLLLELEAKFRDMIDATVVHLTDQTRPREDRFSFTELNREPGMPVTGAGLHLRVKRHRKNHG